MDNPDTRPGLKGTDANNNGIRDDVDQLIAQKYARTPAIQKAAEQEARALQRNLEATTPAAAVSAGQAVVRASSCTDSVLSRNTAAERQYWQDLSTEIEALTVNTEERFRAYWAANRLMNGTVFKQPEGNVCD